MLRLIVLLVVLLLIHKVSLQCVSCNEQGVCSQTQECSSLELTDTELCCSFTSFRLCGCNATIINGTTPGPLFCENCTECQLNRVPCPTQPNNMNKQLLNCFGDIICSNTQNSMDQCTDEGCACIVLSEAINSTCVNDTVIPQGGCEEGEVVVCVGEDACVNLTEAFNLCSSGEGMYGPCDLILTTSSVGLTTGTISSTTGASITTSIPMSPMLPSVDCSNVTFDQGDCEEGFSEACCTQLDIPVTRCVSNIDILEDCESGECIPGKCSDISIPLPPKIVELTQLPWWAYVLIAIGVLLVIACFVGLWRVSNRRRRGFDSM